MDAIPTPEAEDARRPSHERESLVGERTRIINRMKAILAWHGHDARMMPPAYVKPYVRRQKNDGSDAAAICEEVTRPSMRFVGVRIDQAA